MLDNPDLAALQREENGNFVTKFGKKKGKPTKPKEASTKDQCAQVSVFGSEYSKSHHAE